MQGGEASSYAQRFGYLLSVFKVKFSHEWMHRLLSSESIAAMSSYRARIWIMRTISFCAPDSCRYLGTNSVRRIGPDVCRACDFLEIQHILIYLIYEISTL